MRVSLEALRQDIHAVLVAQGVPSDEADVGVEMCLDAELRGHTSHGVRLLRNVVAEYQRGADRRRPIAVIQETPVSAQVDGGFHLSWYVHQFAADLVAAKAAEAGIAVVSVGNAGVSGALGYLAERIASNGLVGLTANSSPVTVVAPGGTVPTLGTNPLAIAVPRREAPPLVLDMATSAIAFNEIVRRRDTAQPLPAGVAVDATGEVTADAGEAIDPASGRGRILPFGGHRGFGLSLMLELLVSAGVTGRVGADKRGPVVLEPADFSALYLAYRPGVVGDAEAALDAAGRLLGEIESGGARIPGESSRLRREQCLEAGSIGLDDDAATLLASLRRQ